LPKEIVAKDLADTELVRDTKSLEAATILAISTFEVINTDGLVILMPLMHQLIVWRCVEIVCSKSLSTKWSQILKGERAIFVSF